MSTASIALCTYNGARFVKEQLESYLSQTRRPDELIVCDDGSTDATVEILQDFAAAAAFPVRVEVNERTLGTIRNFEKAISLCTGEIIFLSDQDDIWAAAKMETMLAAFDSDKEVGIAFSNAAIVDETATATGHDLWSYTFPQRLQADAERSLFDIVLAQNVVTGATMAFRSKFIPVISPMPAGIPNLVHDSWIALVIAARARAAVIDEPLIKYRQHDGQQLGINFNELAARDFVARQKAYATAVEFIKAEIERLERLSDVLAEDPRFALRQGSVDTAGLVEEKKDHIRHLNTRRSLLKARVYRFIPVIRELLTGRYETFSKGVLSAAKDLVEK